MTRPRQQLAARWAAARATATSAVDTWRRSTTSIGWFAVVSVSFLALGDAGLIGGLVLWAVHLRWSPTPGAVAAGAGGVLGLAGATWLLAGVPDVADVYVVTRRDLPSLLAVIGLLALVVAAWRGAHDHATTGRPESPLQELGQALGDLTRPVTRTNSAVSTVLEAVAVVTAVFALTLPTIAPGLVERWLADVAWFAVPGLVLAAGHRAAAADRGPGRTRRRVESLLAPYLAVSVLALGLRQWSAAFPAPGNPIADLLLGATFAPYHLVLTLVVLTLATPLLLRPRDRTALIVFGLAVTAQVAVLVVIESRFWQLRNPLLWVAFFLAGALARRHHDEFARWAGAWPGLLLAWSLCLAAVVVLPPTTSSRAVMVLLATWFLLAALWMVGLEPVTLPRIAWSLAGNAYLVYLLHVPFVLIITGASGTAVPSVDGVVGWLTGMIGALSVIVIARAAPNRQTEPPLGA